MNPSPLTADPLPERLTSETLLTSHQVGALLQVNPSSVKKWVADGILPAFRTPGGHRRLRAGDVADFLRKHRMPVPAPLASAHCPVIVWADDDARYVGSLKRLLKSRRRAVDVHFALTGIDALLLVGLHRPTLVVLDVAMPDIDGVEVCRRIGAREETRLVRVVFVTATEDDEVVAACLSAGAVTVLRKPVTLDEVLAHADTALEVRSA